MESKVSVEFCLLRVDEFILSQQVFENWISVILKKLYMAKSVDEG